MLIPHLVAFSAISQGIRLLAWLLGSNSLLVRVHYSVLLLNIGATLLAAIHGLLSVRVQMLEQRKFIVAARATGRRYGALGLVAAVAFLLASRPLSALILTNGAELSWYGSLALASSFGGLTCYYSMSNCAVREQWTTTLSVLSCSVVVSVGAAVAVVRPEPSFDNLISIYVIAIWSLAALVTFVVCVARKGSRTAGRLVLRGALPFAILTLAGGLIAVT
jgi:hypothetical protein